jgi:glycosyl transferase family 1
LCLEEYSRPLRFFTRLRNALLSFFPQFARPVLTYRLPRVGKAYRRLQSEMPDAIWLITYADGVTQLNGLPTARKIIVDTHDLKFVLASNVANGSGSPTSVRNLLKLRNEIACLNSVSGLVSISPPEKAIFQVLARSADKFYIPAYFKFDEEISETHSVDAEFRFDLLFVASDNLFNVLGFRDFAESNAIWLYKYRIGLVGRICGNKEIVGIAREYNNISLLGYIPDLSNIYRASKAVISPTDGTGLKIKVVDALLHGKPVFGSAHTRDGLPSGYEGCVFPIDRGEIESVLNSSEKRRRAETAALRYARTIDRVNEIDSFLGYLRSN